MLRKTICRSLVRDCWTPDTQAVDEFILLDDAAEGRGISRIFLSPIGIIRADQPEEVIPALEEMESARASGKIVAGFFAYELGYVLEPKLRPLLPANRAMPLLWFGVFNRASQMSSAEADAWLAERVRGDFAVSPPLLTLGPSAYDKRFRKAMEAIREGELYQINLTFKAKFDLFGDRIAFARHLRRRQPTYFSGFIQTPEFSVFSCSPELFFKQEGRRIETRPMKGTAKSKVPPETLRKDEKNRAENVMIVDLMRNDIGRLASPGTVRVESLFDLESHATLHQMTSTVVGEMRDGVDIREMLEAIFPPGSVTGAPKIRAMEIAAALEDGPRGVYSGAVGAFFPNDKALFNVAIRTVLIDSSNHAEIGIGSGIVADSVPESEYEECRIKMKFLAAEDCDFSLFETLRFERETGFHLMERHLSRMAESARTFDFSFNRRKARSLLKRSSLSRREGPLRVKLVLSRDGGLHCGIEPFPWDRRKERIRFALARERVDSSNILLFHKTTRRQFYDQARSALTGKGGCEEVVFLNEREELTEGSFTSLFLRLPGEKVLRTPQLSCGLLPGILRAELLATGKAKESVIIRSDLEKAEAVFLGNSLRGLLEARWVQQIRNGEAEF